MTYPIEHWIVNMLIFSLPFSWYMVYQLWKSEKVLRKHHDDLIEKYVAVVEKHVQMIKDNKNKP